MQDLRGYSNDELSLWFMNDEFLYNQASRITTDKARLKDLADEFFLYTDEQLEELYTDFEQGAFE